MDMLGFILIWASIVGAILLVAVYFGSLVVDRSKEIASEIHRLIFERNEKQPPKN